MDPRPVSMAFPRPGRALTAILIAIGVLGILTALVSSWSPIGPALFAALACNFSAVLHGQVWRLVTSGFLTDPQQWEPLLWTLVGLYFLGASLEKRWGGGRFFRFFCGCIIGGNLTAMLVHVLAGPNAGPRFHPEIVFGATAAISGIAAAWSREFAESNVLLFFVLPVRGRVFLWITIGFCVLNLIYPVNVREGVVAPFGGVMAALLLSGNPSPARAAYLRLRLMFLRGSASNLRARDLIDPNRPQRSRSSAPPLRVVQGGLEEVLKKRKPPKDKRYLN